MDGEKLNYLFGIYTCNIYLFQGLELGSVHGEELNYLFGIPICNVWPHLSHHYTRAEALLSAITITYFTNFAKTG